MPNYYIGGGKGAYTHRHIERAKQELAEHTVEKPKAKGETASGFYVTFQYLCNTSEPVGIKVFVWGNSKINALHLSLNLPEVQEFILAAKASGYAPDHFVVGSGLVSSLTAEAVISKQGY